MADGENSREGEGQLQQPEPTPGKIVGTVKWFNVKSGYGFINRNDNKEDVFVHRSAIKKNNPKKYLRSVGDREVVEFNVVDGAKGLEAADVTGLGGTPVQGSEYAPNRYQYFRGSRGRGRGGRGRGGRTRGRGRGRGGYRRNDENEDNIEEEEDHRQQGEGGEEPRRRRDRRRRPRQEAGDEIVEDGGDEGAPRRGRGGRVGRGGGRGRGRGGRGGISHGDVADIDGGDQGGDDVRSGEEGERRPPRRGRGRVRRGRRGRGRGRGGGADSGVGGEDGEGAGDSAQS